MSREWELRTPAAKRLGGKYLTVSLVHRILTNRFYYGELLWAGKSYAGAHEPMLTREEFDQIQRGIRRPGKAAPKKHRFPFTGLIRCGECGSGITAEHKVNRFGSRYTYYHCTRKHLTSPCAQPAIRAEVLEAQIAAFLGDLRLKPRTQHWILERVAERQAGRQAEQAAWQDRLQREQGAIEREWANLTGLRLRDLITDQEFIKERSRIDHEGRRIKMALDSASTGASWIEPTRTLISGCDQMLFWFLHGDPQTQREIFSVAVSNPTLSDKKLLCQAAFPFFPTGNRPERPTLLGVLDGIRTLWENQDEKLLEAIALCKKLMTEHGPKNPSS